MDQLLSYASRISQETYLRFFECYFKNPHIQEILYYPHSNVKIYFQDGKDEYVVSVSDISLTVTKLYRGVEGSIPEVQPNTDDWLVYMKSIFEEDYVVHYENIMLCKELVEGKPVFLSRIPEDALLAFLQDYVGKKWQVTDCRIKEVESFFHTEKRFLAIAGNKKAYLRLSDFAIITPREFSSRPFQAFMAKSFGEEYLKARQEDLHNNTFLKFST